VQPAEATEQRVFADPERPQKIRAAAEQFRGELEGTLRALGAPGFAWGLVVDDQLVVSGAEGTTRVPEGAPVSTKTLFRIGSITKVFTALAVLRLRDAGQLSLDTPLRQYVREFEGVVYPTADSPELTARHLLLHRSGLPRLGSYESAPVEVAVTESEVLAALDGVPLRTAPGEVSEYSNFGYSLLGPLIGAVAKQPFDRYISEHILVPLGMSHSVWEPDAVPKELLARPHAVRDHGTLEVTPEWKLGGSAADGGIFSSVEDMSRFAAFQLAAWPATSAAQSPVLARSSVRESQRPHALDGVRLRAASTAPTPTPASESTPSPTPPSVKVDGQGLGWAVYRDCRFEQVTWHNGGTEGHRAALYLLPDRGVGVILFANRQRSDLDRPARLFLERLHDAGVLPQRESTGGPNRWSGPLAAQVDAAFALGDEPLDTARIEALFEPRFRAAVPAEKMHQALAASHAELGACHVGAPLRSEHEQWAAAELGCEHGEPQVVEAVLGRDRQLIGLWWGKKQDWDARVRERLEKNKPSNACGN
jgi:CubicO group peptidase (beta-lactamase class C family)